MSQASHRMLLKSLLHFILKAFCSWHLCLFSDFFKYFVCFKIMNMHYLITAWGFTTIKNTKRGHSLQLFGYRMLKTCLSCGWHKLESLAIQTKVNEETTLDSPFPPLPVPLPGELSPGLCRAHTPGPRRGKHRHDGASSTQERWESHVTTCLQIS